MPIYSLSSENKRLNIVHPHIPKTAGTAIADFFRKIGCQVCFGDENMHIRSLMRCPPQHYDYQILDMLFLIEKADYSFVVVRNPFDRIKSDYMWAMTKSTMAGSDISFDEWAAYLFDNYKSNPYILANHIKPQHLFTGPKIKNVFKYEDGLEKIMNTVLSSIGLTTDEEISLQRINTSDDFHEKFPDKLTMNNKTMNRIIDFYRRDFDLFGYNPDDC